MFREMRRKKQAMSEAECRIVLQNGTSGVLAISEGNGYPYAVPLSYVFQDDKIFFHCAKTGHKIDTITKNDKASFCVIDQDQIVPERYTTYYQSVIAFGTVRVLEDEGEKRKAIEIFAAKYSPEDEAGRLKEIDKEFDILSMLELTIVHMTGKKAIELVKE